MTSQTRLQPRVKVCNKSHLNLTIMARLQGISGGMSGRAGSFTYRQSRGETIVSQYQPIVKNPNTQAQQNQRARFKLMSQLAAIMSPGFGTMGITKRPGRQRPTQRNAFMQLNQPLVNVETSADNVTAKIAMEDVKLTSSNRNLGLILADGREISVQSQDTSITNVRFVIVEYIDNDITKPVLRSVQDEVMSDGEAVLTLPAVSNETRFTVLCYGLIPSETASKATLDNLHTPSNENFISAVQLNNLVSAGELIETQTIGVNVTITAA